MLALGLVHHPPLKDKMDQRGPRHDRPQRQPKPSTDPARAEISISGPDNPMVSALVIAIGMEVGPVSDLHDENFGALSVPQGLVDINMEGGLTGVVLTLYMEREELAVAARLPRKAQLRILLIETLGRQLRAMCG